MGERSRVVDPEARRREFLIFGKPAIGEAEVVEVVESLRSGWVGTGPKVARFERGLSEYVGMPHVRCTSSCSAALYLALKLRGIGAGDEVIVPSMTFVATANAVEHIGATPILVDVEPYTGLLDFQAAEAAVTPRTRAVLPVHMAGRPVDQEALRAFAARYELTVIEDAAHAIGAEWRSRRVGAHGHLTAFSFYANKNVSTGEGGALVCPDEALAARAGRLARQGLPSDAWSAFTERGHAEQDVEEPGLKFNMTDLAASLGIHQLARLDASIEYRAGQWEEYDDALKSLPLTPPPSPAPGTRHARHLYQVLVDRDARVTRDELREALRDRGVGSGVHYRAVHLHRYYGERYSIAPDALPVAADLAERTLSLPIGPGVSQEDLEYVIDSLRDVLV